MVGSGTPAVHRRDAVAVPEPPGAGLRALDAGRSHDGADLPVRGLAGDGPERPVRTPRARLEPSQPVHELKRVHQVLLSVTAYMEPFDSPRGPRGTRGWRGPRRPRHPVIARVRARVWTPGLGCARAEARKRSRSFAVRYLRPRASTRVKVPSVMDRKATLLPE